MIEGGCEQRRKQDLLGTNPKGERSPIACKFHEHSFVLSCKESSMDFVRDLHTESRANLMTYYSDATLRLPFQIMSNYHNCWHLLHRVISGWLIITTSNSIQNRHFDRFNWICAEYFDIDSKCYEIVRRSGPCEGQYWCLKILFTEKSDRLRKFWFRPRHPWGDSFDQQSILHEVMHGFRCFFARSGGLLCFQQSKCTGTHTHTNTSFASLICLHFSLPFAFSLSLSLFLTPHRRRTSENFLQKKVGAY